MNRSEHLQWSKDRALEYVTNGDHTQAFASFMSDMRKHAELENHLALDVGMTLLISGNLASPEQMRQWIEGFN